jgi:hypothetical protein
VEAPGGEHMRLDQEVEWAQRGGAGADLVGERRQAQGDAFARVAVALAVQGLVLAELLEQHHREQAGPEHAARGDVERRRRLTDALAGTARKALAHRLDDLPLARDYLECLGGVFAELGELVRSAAWACRRRCHDDALAR